MTSFHRFRDRLQAGHELAQDLTRFLQGRRPFILAIPPHGVLVAASIATELNAPFDIVVSRRILTEGNPDEALGAITPDRTLVVNKSLATRLNLTSEQVDQMSIPEWAEAQRAQQLFRRGRPSPNLRGYTAVIVDDGLTTVYTAMGAIIAARKMEPDDIILAAPVSSLAAIERLHDYVDSVLTLEINAQDNYSVAQYYVQYPPMRDQEVIWTLDHLWRDRATDKYTETF
ncbi:MAG: phosphoribosyltransferase family protein [Chloroflexia bacterium]